MKPEVIEFHARFLAEVRDRAIGNGDSTPDFAVNSFTEYVIELLSSEVGIIEGAEPVYFEGEVGRGKARVNGFGLAEETADQETIDLFVSIYRGHEDIAHIPAEEMNQASQQAVRFLLGALGGLHEHLDPSSERRSMCQRIHSAGSRIKRARLFVITDGHTDLARRKPLVARPSGSPVEFQIEFWDIERMARAFAYGQPRQEIEIDLVELLGSPLACVAAGNPKNEYQTFLMILPGELLYRIYDTYGARLLERNVRSFLQAKGKVNSGIRKTLRTEPNRFLAYNNGISMTADDVQFDRRSDGSVGLCRITGLQIVNGGQTTASIHRAARTDRADLSVVHVQAKLTVLKPDHADSIAPFIAQFANTQNPIQMADFSANDPFHVELERLSALIWTPDQLGKWFYERARGQYQAALAKEGDTAARRRRFKEVSAPERKLTKLDVAKVLTAWDQLPHIVCMGGQKCFVQFTQLMRERRPKTWKPDETYFKHLAAKAIIFKTAERLARKELDGFRAQVAAYTVASLSHRTADQLDLSLVWSNQAVTQALEGMMREWLRRISTVIIESAGTRNPSEWCKKSDCWLGVQQVELPWPKEVPPELERLTCEGGGWGVRPDEVRRSIDPDELDAHRRCREATPVNWIRIVEWGTATGRLDASQQRLASEIARLAAQGWNKELTGRKAKDGRVIVNLAIEHGVFDDTEQEAAVSREVQLKS